MNEEALNLYRKFFPRTPLNFVQIDLIQDQVKNLSVWKSVLHEWAGNGWRGESVFKMLRMYDEKQVRSGSAYVGAEREMDIQPPVPCDLCHSVLCLGGKACDDRAANIPYKEVTYESSIQ
jgi:hypothetical protein